MERTALKALALALICRPGSLSPEKVRALSAADWAQIFDWGQEHRFLPYLHYALKQAHLLELVPPDLSDQLQPLRRSMALRALAAKGDMVRVHQTLEDAGIAHVFLKGAYLAEFAYPEPSLRPLRDIDVLVARPEAIDAYERLQAAGFARDPYYTGHIEAYLEGSKHLPRLIAPDGRAAVELHVQLTESTRYSDAHRTLRAEAVLARAQSSRVAHHDIRFPTPEDMLVHLCVHAVYEHQFNIGPLILPDLHWLLATHSIDWKTVWADAAEQGVTRGVALVLRVLQQQWPGSLEGQPHDLLPLADVDDTVAHQAADMMLRSFAARNDVAILEGVQAKPTLAGKLSFVLSKAFPAPSELAKQFPRSPNSLAIVMCYPVLWRRLLQQRLPDLIANVRTEHNVAEATALSRISAWLAG
ncbi:nucleotidyltransferase family protein [Blastomonas sp. AAP53]|uniref:nucleotidyltransferase domain-containing protein n=1 Tax=Blastomonas sp. AAP53 TaxID=1248760 RepID=UPI0002D73798|nr:nucleotidyltransferase family protein [Blastomonas sp. AAP53]